MRLFDLPSRSKINKVFQTMENCLWGVRGVPRAIGLQTTLVTVLSMRTCVDDELYIKQLPLRSSRAVNIWMKSSRMREKNAFLVNAANGASQQTSK